MNVTEAIKKRRSIRKFKQIPVKHEDLLTIIDSARYAAYGANMQPLKFAIMENADEVYPLTRDVYKRQFWNSRPHSLWTPWRFSSRGFPIDTFCHS